MLHHLGLLTSDLRASARFYVAALAPLGVVLGYESEVTAELWHADHDTPSISLETAPAEPTRGLHVAFAARSREEVDRFYAAALGAGATARHPPRFWPEYGAYCAFVNDPDGNNVEALCKESAGG